MISGEPQLLSWLGAPPASLSKIHLHLHGHPTTLIQTPSKCKDGAGGRGDASAFRHQEPGQGLSTRGTSLSQQINPAHMSSKYSHMCLTPGLGETQSQAISCNERPTADCESKTIKPSSTELLQRHQVKDHGFPGTSVPIQMLPSA